MLGRVRAGGAEHDCGGKGRTRLQEGNTRPDVILLDLMLPDMDGWDVCRQLRNDPLTRDIPIVVLTARDEAYGARRAREAGCAA